tara:strand:+ start:740 stop:1183 length:444 start_codon:yes stop_codon:yes gene_type:complete
VKDQATKKMMKAVHWYGLAVQNQGEGKAQGQAYHSVCSEAAALDAKFTALVEACEAHAAWHWAEENHASSTFNERMELAKFSQWLTMRALAAARGDVISDAEYEGVSALVVWPSIYISRADQDAARAIVDRLIAEFRVALKQAKGEA